MPFHRFLIKKNTCNTVCSSSKWLQKNKLLQKKGGAGKSESEMVFDFLKQKEVWN